VNVPDADPLELEPPPEGVVLEEELLSLELLSLLVELSHEERNAVSPRAIPNTIRLFRSFIAGPLHVKAPMQYKAALDPLRFVIEVKIPQCANS
jgi:hypothetical protein